MAPTRRTKKSAVDQTNRPTRAAAENAVRTLIQWAGDDPNREGLRGTPARVVRAYEEWFAGYFEDPREYLQRTFEEVAGYDEMVLLRDIRFESHCEHHIAPIIGRVHIGYLPRRRVLGISKLVRLVDVYAKRMSPPGPTALFVSVQSRQRSIPAAHGTITSRFRRRAAVSSPRNSIFQTNPRTSVTASFSAHC